MCLCNVPTGLAPSVLSMKRQASDLGQQGANGREVANPPNTPDNDLLTVGAPLFNSWGTTPPMHIAATADGVVPQPGQQLQQGVAARVLNKRRRRNADSAAADSAECVIDLTEDSSTPQAAGNPPAPGNRSDIPAAGPAAGADAAAAVKLESSADGGLQEQQRAQAGAQLQQQTPQQQQRSTSISDAQACQTAAGPAAVTNTKQQPRCAPVAAVVPAAAAANGPNAQGTSAQLASPPAAAEAAPVSGAAPVANQTGVLVGPQPQQPMAAGVLPSGLQSAQVAAEAAAASAAASDAGTAGANASTPPASTVAPTAGLSAVQGDAAVPAAPMPLLVDGAVLTPPHAGLTSSREAAAFEPSEAAAAAGQATVEPATAADTGEAGVVAETAAVGMAAGAGDATAGGAAAAAAGARGAQAIEETGAATGEAVAGEGTAAGAAGEAAAVADVAGGLSVPQLKTLLQQVCADKRDVKDHIVPVRYLAKLLHGPDVDYSTVQVAQLLPHLTVLLQHMRDRVCGSVEGKSTLQPRNAAKHAACMLRVLGLPEVQAVLGGQQQVQELLGTVQAAQQEYEAMQSSSDATQPFSNNTAADVPAQVQADVMLQQPAAADTAGAAAAAAEAAADVTDGQQGAAGGVVSVAQLSELLESHQIAATTQQRVLTTVKHLLQLVHGQDADAATVQLPSLLLEWPVLEEHLLQRIQGPVEGRRGLCPASALRHTSSVLKLLDMPQVCGQLSPDEVLQLRQQVQAAAVAWKPLDTWAATLAEAAGPARAQRRQQQTANMGSEDGSTSDSSSSSSSSSEDDDDFSAPSASGGAAPMTRKRSRQMATSRPKRSCALAAAAAIAAQAEALAAPLAGLPRLAKVKAEGVSAQGRSTAQVAQPSRVQLQDNSAQGLGQGLSMEQLQQLGKQQLAVQDLVNRMIPLRALAKLLHGRQYDPKAVQIADLLRRFDVLSEHLVQRVAGEDESTSALSANTALAYVYHVVSWTKEPIVQAQLSADELQELQDRIEAAKAALGQGAASKAKGRKAQQPAASASALAAQDSSEQQERETAERNAAACAPAAAGRVKHARTAVLQVPAEAAPAAAPAQVPTPATPAPAGQAAPGAPAVPATLAAVLSSERDLLAAQRQLLWLYSHKLSPSLSAKVTLRSTMQMLAGLTPGDIRLDRFWTDYDWLLMLNDESESTAEHWNEAFDTLLSNANKGP